MARAIRDALYGYVAVSRIEHDLLGQPEALRLHRILQNSSIYHTYVSNRGSRFPHSVGAMHVAGKLYHSLTRNLPATHGVFGEFDGAVQELLPHAKTTEEQIRAYLRPSDLDPLYHGYGWDADDWRHILRFQGVRLAAMVHDIGHPPYSHVVEFALGDARRIPHAGELRDQAAALESTYRNITAFQGKATPDIHEMTGIVLTDVIFGRMGGEAEPFARAALQIAARILAADQFGHHTSRKAQLETRHLVDDLRAWYLLGQFVSGEVDCDRLDYLRRDPRNSGVIDFGHIDLDRIIHNIGVEKRELARFDDERIDAYVPNFNHRAVSALETFFNERLRQFRWLVCHHNVVRTDMALNRAVFNLIDIATIPMRRRTPLRKLLDERKFSELWRWDNLDRFARIDDAWLEQLLADVHDYLANSAQRTPQEGEILLLLDVFLYRKVARLRSLWKRLDEFIPFAQGVHEAFKAWYPERSDIRLPWPHNTSEAIALRESLFAKNDPFAAVRFTNSLQAVIKFHAGTTGMTRRLEAIESHVDPERRFLFVIKPFTAYKGVDVGGKDLDQMSSLVRNLNTLWREGLSIYAFERDGKLAGTEDERNVERRRLGERFAEAVNQLIQLPSEG